MTLDLFAEDLSALEEIDPNKDYHSELVGEGKKYQDDKALAYSRVVADNHIKRLEAEQAALRRDLETRMEYERFLDQLKSTMTTQSSNPEQPNQGEQPNGNSAIKPEDIEALVSQQLKQMRNQETANNNLAKVEQKLKEAYGPDYSRKLKQQINELGIDENTAKQFAMNSPNALFKLLGVDEKKEVNFFQTPPTSRVTGLPSGSKKGYSAYEELRRTKPTEYFSPKIQNEMLARMNEMGKEAFLNS